MAKTPTVSFRAEFPVDAEFDHPPGATLARELQAKLSRELAEVREFDNWRDCGWSIDGLVESTPVQVFFTQVNIPTGAPLWLLGCTSGRHVSILARLLGRAPDDSAAVLQLARAVDQILKSEARVSEVKWYMNDRWRGPDDREWVDAPS